MKRITAIIALLILCINSLVWLAPASYAVAEPPIPFRPTDELKKQQIEESKQAIGTIEIGTAATAEDKANLQKIPIFSIKTSGIKFVITALFFTAAPIALIVIVYSAIRLIIKPEDEEMTTRIKRTLIFSAIGLLIMALSYAIVQNVITIF